MVGLQNTPPPSLPRVYSPAAVSTPPAALTPAPSAVAGVKHFLFWLLEMGSYSFESLMMCLFFIFQMKHPKLWFCFVAVF